MKINSLNSKTNSYLIEIEETCNLFDNFSVIVQFILGWFVLGILICKKFFLKISKKKHRSSKKILESMVL